jgi:hypothetical protein
MLLVASLLVLVALGAVGGELQPSALRVMVAAVFGLLAVLFWPGCAASPVRTTLRVAAWSATAAGLAAIMLTMLGNPPQPLAQVLASCAMLLLMLLPAHALAAWLEGLLMRRAAAAPGARSAMVAVGARELAGRVVAGTLALLGALPLWLGPAGELLSDRHPWLIDVLLGISPLTHLAVASGNDLLRNQWFYQHANLAALPFDYPGLRLLLPGYGLAVAVTALLVLTERSACLRRSAGEPSNAP